MRFYNEIAIVTALFISLTYLFGLVQPFLQFKAGVLKALSYGVFFALLALVGMMNPVELSPGVLVDGTTLVIAFSAVFGGAFSSLITALVCLIYRIHLGGVGFIPGIVAIVFSLFAGLYFRYIFLNDKIKKNNLFFIMLGISSAGIWCMALLFFPDIEMAMALAREFSLPVLLFTPVLSLFLGTLILREIRHYSMEKDLAFRIRQNKMVFTVSSDGFYELKFPGKEMFLDPNSYILAGYIKGDFPMKYEEWMKRIHPEDRPRIREKMRRFSLGLEIFFDEEYKFQRKDKSWIWIREKAVITERDQNGDTLKILGTYSNIDNLKNIQHELKRLYMGIEQAAEVIMITDVEGIIQYVNPSFFQITGYTREEAVGRKANFLKSGEQSDEFYRELWSTISSGTVWKGQLRNRRKNGTDFIEQLVISPVREENGVITAYVAIIKDITKDLSFKEQLGQSQKMQAVGQLAGGVAHDFNNMLTGIMTASLMLKKKLRDDVQLMKYVSIIDQAVDRSADLTRSLLNFSRKQPQALNIIDIHKSINNTVKLMKSTTDKQISIITRLNAHNSTIIGDASQIENSILNIGINATHAIKSEGCITIYTDLVYFNHTNCEENAFEISPGYFIHLSISDNGCGMDEQTKNKVFEPFFTTKVKSKGTGLGLSSVYAMIKQHKGTLAINSEVDRGTDFNLYFPLVNENSIEIDENEATSDEINKEEGCILLVDDEELIRKTVEDMLIDAGYEVLVANDGEMALNIFRENHRKIDLIILDMIMPRMNGLECLKAIRKIKPDMKVIAESGFLEEEKMIELKTLGIQGFINKPGTVSAIQTAIKDAINGGISN